MATPRPRRTDEAELRARRDRWLIELAWWAERKREPRHLTAEEDARIEALGGELHALVRLAGDCRGPAPGQPYRETIDPDHGYWRVRLADGSPQYNESRRYFARRRSGTWREPEPAWLPRGEEPAWGAAGGA